MADCLLRFRPVPVQIFADDLWQMSLGERAAVEGVLAQLKPALAIEIGSAEGACLRRIAAHAGEVHSFDLAAPIGEPPENVTRHTGDSHELLPAFLAQVAGQSRTVDFVLVDGDHSPEGVRRDIEDLLDCTALTQTVILIHDTANERVRRGLDAVRFTAWPKVAHVELDWIPGQLFAEPALRNELWYGLGLVVLDSSRLAYRSGSVYEQRYHPAAALLSESRELVVARERVPARNASDAVQATALRRHLVRLEAQLGQAWTRAGELSAALATGQQRLDGAERALRDIKGSASWRATEPLRTAKRRVAQIKR